MNNSGFVQIDTDSKVKNILDILNKRCCGKIRPDILNSVAQRLNPSKQMKINVISMSEAKEKMKSKITTTIKKGTVENINIDWCKCVLGNAKIGRKVEVIEDGVDRIIEDIDTEIQALPLIMQVDNQDLGDIKLNSSQLFICL